MIPVPIYRKAEQVSKDTFCPKLWQSAYISEKGDVFKCCHATGSALGNINSESLESIWGSIGYRLERQKSLEGKLDCFASCTLLDKSFRPMPPADVHPHYQHLQWLQISFGELCNIACIMCWQDHRSRTMLDHESVIKNVDIGGLRNITLQGGEPLAIGSLRRYFDYLTSSGKKVSLMTNGLLIDDEWADKIARHSEFIYLSLNAASKPVHELVNKGSRWEKVFCGIDRIQNARARHQSSISIVGHMTIVPQNIHEIGDFVRKSKSFGFDRINFGFDSSAARLLKEDVALRERVSADLKLALDAINAPGTIEKHRLKMLGVL